MTLLKFALLGASAAVLCLPAAAQAAHAGGVDTDARCMAVGLMMTSAKDDRTRSMGAQFVTYYYGHAQGRGGVGGLESRLAAQFQALTTTKPAPGQTSPAQVCFTEMQASFANLKPITEHMAHRFGHPAPAGAPAPATPAPTAPPAH